VWDGYRRLPAATLCGVEMKGCQQTASQAQGGLLNEVVGDLGCQEDRQPTEGKGVEELEGGAEEAPVVVVQKQRLPDVDAVRENSYVGEDARVEQPADDRPWVADAPEQEERDCDATEGKTDGELPVVHESRTQQIGQEDYGRRDPPDPGCEVIEALEERGSLQESDEAAEHEGVRTEVEAVAVVQQGPARYRKTKDPEERRYENDCEGDLTGLEPALKPGAAETVEKKEGPEKVELLFDAEGPEVLQRPHVTGGVVVEKEEGGNDVDFEDGLPTRGAGALRRRHREEAECAWLGESKSLAG
jgi:hypothetical protein